MVAQKYEKSQTWLAWAGDMDAVRRVARLVSEIEQKRPAESVSTIESLNRVRHSLEKQRGEGEGDTGKYVTPINLTISEGTTEFTSRLEHGIEQVDRRAATGLTIRTDGSYSEKIVLELGSSRYFSEIKLSVTSADVDFARTAFAQIADEVEKGVPWWAKGWKTKTFALALAIVVIVAFCVGLVAGRNEGNLAINWLAFGIAAGLSAMPLLGVTVAAPPTLGAFSWLFPTFEITGDGMSSATRRLSAALLLLLSIPIGVLVNLIS